MKKRYKYYAILSKKDNFLYGAFELSPKGKTKAEEYIKKTSKHKDLYIKRM